VAGGLRVKRAGGTGPLIALEDGMANRVIPKTHVKKKVFRAACKQHARDGRINNAAGQWVPRGSLPDNSMKRDYYPQGV
jgi:hypothetical protein